VCQDQTHVFCAAARSLGFPARYVAGYLLAGEGEDWAHETHAWAEAHVEGLGWVGFDPSADVCPTDRYVRLCSGLDARGAAPIRGSVGGGSAETLEAGVEIAEAPGGAAAAREQTQQ
jgi:Transglutaminase-like enzymes, putative cysteine proteases